MENKNNKGKDFNRYRSPMMPSERKNGQNEPVNPNFNKKKFESVNPNFNGKNNDSVNSNFSNKDYDSINPNLSESNADKPKAEKGNSLRGKLDNMLAATKNPVEALKAKGKRKIYFIVGGAAVALLSIVLVLGALLKVVEPIAEIVGAVVQFTNNVVNATQNFFESAKNLFKYGQFAKNEQVLFNKITEANKLFSTQFSKRINIPLVSAALYYDGNQEEWHEKTFIVVEDGKEVEVNKLSNEKLDERVEFMDAIFDMLISIKEVKYRCGFTRTSDGTMSPVTTFISSTYVESIDPTRKEKACPTIYTEDIPDEDKYIYYYSYAYDEKGFEFRLINTYMEFEYNSNGSPKSMILNPVTGYLKGEYKILRNMNTINKKIEKYPLFREKMENNEVTLIDLLYTETLEEVVEVSTIVQDIMLSYEVWKFIYGIEDDYDERCYFPGNIPKEMLTEIRAPFNGYYYITSRYGNRPNPVGDSDKKYEYHNGIDIVAKEDTTIYAVYDGVVSESSFDTGGGNYVTIQHTIGATTFYSQYMHMESPSSLAVGNSVAKGTAIGVMGSTGRSTGAHLHFGFYTLKDGKKSYMNPENLFSDAENYQFNCVSSKTEPNEYCTLNGGAAVYSFKSKYGFDLIRAIISAETSGNSDYAVMKLHYDLDTFKEIYERNKSKYSEIDGKIDFEGYTVKTEGSSYNFKDPQDVVGRRAVLEYIGQMDKKVYDSISIGLNMVPTNAFSLFEYKSPKEMYETLYSNNFELIQAMVEYTINNNPFIEEILSTVESYEGPLYTVKSGESLQSIAQSFGISPYDLLRAGESQSSVVPGNRIKLSDSAVVNMFIKAFYSHIPAENENNKYLNEFNYANKVLEAYLNMKDDPDSNIENYMNDCLIIPVPGWEDCSTYEEEGKCNKNIETYRGTAKWFADTAPTNAGKRALAYAMSLWGKVRYCGACGIGDAECIDIKPDGTIGKHAFKYGFSAIRCSPWAHAYYKEGFNPKWGTLHSYTYKGTPYYKNESDENANIISYQNDGGDFTAGLAGLDCAGYVNWVLNHTFQVFDSSTFSVMDTVCNSETDYTVSTQFESVPEFTSFGDSILPLLTPGDILCNSTGGKYGEAYNYSGNSRHVMIFMGYEDANFDAIPNSGDKVIIIHSSDIGVRVDRKDASDKYWKELNSYATYK